MPTPTYNHPWNEQSSSSSSNTLGSQFPPPPESYGWTGLTGYPSVNYSNAALDPPYGVGRALDEATLNAARPQGSAYETTSHSPSVSSTSAVRLSSPQSIDFTSNVPMNNSNSSNRSHVRPMDPPPMPQKPNPRNSTVTQADWEKHELEIKRLWLEEKKPLPVTMEIMSQKFNFKASTEQYKKQLKKWDLSKYLPAKEGNWMLSKAIKRKQEDDKETVFQFRGQEYTEDTIRQRLQRKKLEPEKSNVAADAPTPKGIKYATPRNDIPSPMDTSFPYVPRPQPKWTPPPISNPRYHQLRLMWNGLSKVDLDAMYQEALAAERLGRLDEAEKKFRDTLAGFENLLSSTNPDTKAVAYRLASFYAKNDRMKDADAVFDWVTDRHIQSYGFAHSKTIDHLLKVVEMFRNWSRAADAVTYLEQILQAMENQTFSKDLPRNGPQNPILVPDDPSFETGMHSTTSASHQPYPDFSVPAAGPSKPAMIESQPSMMAAETGNTEATESQLLRLIQHCEQHPGELATHALRCRTALLEHYDEKGSEEKMNEALDQAQQAFWGILHSDQQKTRALFEACIDLTKRFVKAGRYQAGDDMFIQLQSDMVETPRLDDRQVITLLERIGLFYQGQGMWGKALSRFEQALAACYARYGEQSEHAKRLETALETGHYEIYVPSLEDGPHPAAEITHLGPGNPLSKLLLLIERHK